MNSLGKEDTGSDERRIHLPAQGGFEAWWFSFEKDKKKTSGTHVPLKPL